jgi:rubredoxin
MSKHTCGVCGWEYDLSEGAFENLPEDYVCPVCGAGKEVFEASEEAEAAAEAAPAEDDDPKAMYQCQVSNCGYIYRPDKGDRKGKVPAGTSFAELSDDWHCPVCGAGKKMFKKLG